MIELDFAPLKKSLSPSPLTDADLVSSVKARLFPLTPFTQLLEQLVERLPRKLVVVRLTPQDNVIEIDGNAGAYKAISNEPNFQIAIDPLFAKGGWFYLEAALVRHTGDREARIFGTFDQDGHSSEFEIPIPSNLRGSVREVFYLPGPVTSLFWTPMRSQGFFSQSVLLVHRISAVESFLRRAHRVLLTLWSMRGIRGEARHGLTWLGAVANLHATYIQTARLKIQRYRGHDYQEFIARHDTVQLSELDALTASIRESKPQPLISLIMQVCNPQLDTFLEAIRAIQNQSYRHWELWLSVDRSVPKECCQILEAAQRGDSRIFVVDADDQACAATRLNTLLHRIKGSFFAVLGQHDLMPRHALLYIASAVQSQPNAVVVYTDHDCIDTHGLRYAPHFKPDWNPDYFTSFDYMANLRLWQTETVRRLGGFRQGFDGAEEYDLTLRCIAKCKHEQILHIPRILYHRRSVGANGGSLCAERDEQSWDAGLRALSDHVSVLGATVERGALPGIYRVHHPVPSPAPLVSIIVPTRDKVEVLKACVESVQNSTGYAAWELLIVDNGSVEDQTLAWFEQAKNDPRIRILSYPGLFNYSAIINFAVQYAKGEIVVLLNNDVEVISRNWLTEMVGHALRPEIGAVGAKLLYPNGLVQHAGVVLGIGGVAGHVHRYLGGTEPGYCFRAIVTQNYSAVTAACLAVRKAVYEQVGGLDEVNLKVAFNDVDFCLKLLKAGYRNVFTPYALLYHHESLSRGHDDTPEKKAIFEREFGYMKTTWGKINDPAYNPNLSLEFEDFSLRRF